MWKCIAMPRIRESICCCEIERVELKVNESENSAFCITVHKGFSSVCLNVWVLQQHTVATGTTMVIFILQ